MRVPAPATRPRTRSSSYVPLWVVLICHLAIALGAMFGIPVSTTHTITGAIVGVGSRRRLSAVQWSVVWAWILTIPCTAAISALLYLPFRLR